MMQLTKYPQSCLVVEVGGHRLLIDPGTFLSAKYDLDDLGQLDGVLITHRHPDHIDPALVQALRFHGWPMYGNDDVVELLGPDLVTAVTSRQPFEVGGVPVVPHDLPHVRLVDGSPGPPNTGYLIDGHLFHPGDGVELTGVGAAIVAAPISGPSISFRDAYRLVELLGARTVVPIHYDYFTADPHHFARVCDLAEVLVLEDGASTVV
jgi:L-ascorbate metabolism protein UlaG (beta-lactamase superfamily)